MLRFKFFMILATAIIMFNSCANKMKPSQESEAKVITPQSNTTASQAKKSYGAYIAGRVAHIRKDFNSAANYYMQALKEEPNNPELVGRVYLILTAKGRIDEAAKYAEISRKQGDQNNFIFIITAIDKMKKGQYTDAGKDIQKVDGIIYKEFINPLLTAWAYAGAGDQKKALAALDVIKKEPSFRALYHFQAGMINDYFDDSAAARQDYEVLVNEENLEMSFRALQIISNFYIRNNQKEQALNLVKKYGDTHLLADMMQRLQDNVNNSDPKKTPKIVADANIGNAEALFSIAATLRQGASGVDLAHMFISLSIYENPKYDLAKLLMADILESREMYGEANEVYDDIDQTSESYYTAQLKKANNLVLMEDYQAAELLLKSLALESQNYQIYIDLGDVLRVSDKAKESLKYYEKALEALPKVENQHWVLFYAMGISYEQNDQWDKAEAAFSRALDLSQNHYIVLNYLGYSWLKQGKNVNQAFSMIVDAYNQVPHDGNIADSLGWSFYRLGLYPQAVEYLEKASELEPANAIINDHLGDAYWLNGRHNEARFQWKHALSLKEPSGELDRKAVTEKLDNAGVVNKPLSYDAEIIKEKSATIVNDKEETAE